MALPRTGHSSQSLDTVTVFKGLPPETLAIERLSSEAARSIWSRNAGGIRSTICSVQVSLFMRSS